VSHPRNTAIDNKEKKMKNRFSRKALVFSLLAIGLVVLVARTALALSNVSLKLGTIASYDFGGYGPGYPVPGTIQIHAFTMNPGDTVPWHYHKGVSYVIVARGTLTEHHLVGPDRCAFGGSNGRERVCRIARSGAQRDQHGQRCRDRLVGDDIPGKRWDRSFQPRVQSRRRIPGKRAELQLRVWSRLPIERSTLRATAALIE
jgi:hypothetical protein